MILALVPASLPRPPGSPQHRTQVGAMTQGPTEIPPECGGEEVAIRQAAGLQGQARAPGLLLPHIQASCLEPHASLQRLSLAEEKQWAQRAAGCGPPPAAPPALAWGSQRGPGQAEFPGEPSSP